MMRGGNLERRLVALEKARGTRSTGHRPSMDAVNLMVLLIAGNLGGMIEREAVMSAYGRALGYDASSLKSALGADPGTPAQADRDRRHADAVARLLALKGASIDGDEERACEALLALFEDLPEHVRRHPFGHQIGISLNGVVDSFP